MISSANGAKILFQSTSFEKCADKHYIVILVTFYCVEITIDIRYTVFVPRACDQNSRLEFSSMNLRIFNSENSPKKDGKLKEGNLDVCKLKHFLVCKCSFVCSKCR